MQQKGHFESFSKTKVTGDVQPTLVLGLVIARPDDVMTFLKIRNLLTDFQVELDTSWAVLGEIYGRFSEQKLNHLGLKIRRIRSNLDDLGNFSKSIKYVPVHAAFTTADPAVLDLLVRPLYNNDCSFGVRELVQNAVDAVLELRQYQINHSEYKDLPIAEQDADVVVKITTNRKDKSLWLTVTDRGIGMTDKMICDYFLRAGASFRESDVWRKEFLDIHGKSRISRSGRFGIGVLACFLIGPEITVSTRRAGTPSSEGIEFTASPYTSMIQLNRVSRQVGTEVRIRVFDHLKSKYDTAKWISAMDWYYLSDPSVRIEINGKEIKPKYSLPDSTARPLPLNWRSTSDPDYQSILWSHIEAPALTCNGLRILENKQKDSVPLLPKHPTSVSIRIPNIFVSDYDGNLPLNLQRTQLTQDIPFEKKLFEDVLRDFLSFALVYSPHTSIADTSTWDFYQQVAYLGVDVPIRQLAPWFCTEHGVSYLDSWHASQVRSKSSIAFFMDSQNELLQLARDVGPMSIIALQWPPINRYFDDPHSPQAILYSLLLRKPDPELNRIASTVGVRILLSTGFLSLFERVAETDYQGAKHFSASLQKFARPYGSRLHRIVKVQNQIGEWYVLSSGDCRKPSKEFASITKNLPEKSLRPRSSVLAEWYFSEKSVEADMSPISNAWRQFIRKPVIPYDEEQRRDELADAFAELLPYIEAHEREKAIHGVTS